MFEVAITFIIVCSVISLFAVELNCWLENGRSYIFTNHKVKNTLYQCFECTKLYRTYQEKLFIKTNNMDKERSFCPHCKATSSGYYGGIAGKELKRQPKWADTHPDCPKINMLQHMKVKRTARQILHNRKLQKDQEFFEEYNKVKIDFSWIENLKDSVK